MEVKPATVWKDNDPRHTTPRYVRVILVDQRDGVVQTVTSDERGIPLKVVGWSKKAPRVTSSKLKRFTTMKGRGGFTFVRMADTIQIAE